MYPLAFATLGAALVAFWLAWIQPHDTERLNNTRANVYAENFWAYRDALVAYQNDNFQNAIGPVSNAALTTPMPQRPSGYVKIGYQFIQTGTPSVNLWKNYFEGGRLYTFSSIPARNLPPGVIDAVFNYRGRSLMMGIKQADGTMSAAFRLDTPPNPGAIFTLPAVTGIPVGALVVVGN
jgi:hypothetical protein